MAPSLPGDTIAESHRLSQAAGIEIPAAVRARNPNHHQAILALSTAFWDAYLRGDDEAKAWVDGEDARKVLEPADRWRTK